jgi:hypothetical protein
MGQAERRRGRLVVVPGDQRGDRRQAGERGDGDDHDRGEASSTAGGQFPMSHTVIMVYPGR